MEKEYYVICYPQLSPELGGIRYKVGVEENGKGEILTDRLKDKYGDEFFRSDVKYSEKDAAGLVLEVEQKMKYQKIQFDKNGKPNLPFDILKWDQDNNSTVGEGEDLKNKNLNEIKGVEIDFTYNDFDEMTRFLVEKEIQEGKGTLRLEAFLSEENNGSSPVSFYFGLAENSQWEGEKSGKEGAFYFDRNEFSDEDGLDVKGIMKDILIAQEKEKGFDVFLGMDSFESLKKNVLRAYKEKTGNDAEEFYYKNVGRTLDGDLVRVTAVNDHRIGATKMYFGFGIYGLEARGMVENLNKAAGLSDNVIYHIKKVEGKDGDYYKRVFDLAGDLSKKGMDYSSNEKKLDEFINIEWKESQIKPLACYKYDLFENKRLSQDILGDLKMQELCKEEKDDGRGLGIGVEKTYFKSQWETSTGNKWFVLEVVERKKAEGNDFSNKTYWFKEDFDIESAKNFEKQYGAICGVKKVENEKKESVKIRR